VFDLIDIHITLTRLNLLNVCGPRQKTLQRRKEN